jgi:hypothetical protein
MERRIVSYKLEWRVKQSQGVLMLQLEGDPGVHQVPLHAQDFTAVAALLGAGGVPSFRIDESGDYVVAITQQA